MSDPIDQRHQVFCAQHPDTPPGPFSDEEQRIFGDWQRFGPPSDPTGKEQLAVLEGRFGNHVLFSAEADAWHEAGHAVVGYVLGYSIVRIARDQEGTPHVGFNSPYLDRLNHGPPPTHRSRADFLEQNHDWAVIRVAGYVSEQRATGRCDPGEAYRLVVRMAKTLHYTPDQQRAYLGQIEGEATAILEQHHASVERLARLLEREMDRSGEEVLAAIRGTTPASP